MRLSAFVIVAVAFVLAAILSLVAAGFAVSAIEDGSESAVRRALDSNGKPWAEVQADGLKVILSGTAPSEAARFEAISTTGGVVDASRIIDQMQVAATADLAPPRFSAEILRNDSGISIIGLIPAASDRDGLIRRMRKIAGGASVTDLLEAADYPVPEGWDDAMDFAVVALSRLPRSKISVDAGQISITAISDSVEAKRELENDLRHAAPPALRLALSIAAPRPVITPFTLRFLIDEDGARFDACSAETGAAADRILNAARKVGMTGNGACTIGMGVPSPDWAEAAELAIAALAELGQGTVTFADADITLVAASGTDQARFDRVVGELETALPDVFALHAVLPVPDATGADAGPVEFTATRSPEGQVQLRGRLSDANLRLMADSYAKAAFGSDNVYTATRLVGDLPSDWPVRVLVGLEGLSMLTNGVVTVTPDNLEVRGTSSREAARADIARLIAAKLGEGEAFTLDITYRAPPKPDHIAPPPGECEAMIAAVQATEKIRFEPGSATIASESLETMNAIAEILKACGDIRLEIQGHTDSQGRESMNQELSQARAQSVLNELRARRVLTATYVAKGYGEARPIGDNKTEAGREANRRIEFRLIRPDPIPEVETTLEAIEAAGQVPDAAGAAADAAADAAKDDSDPDHADEKPTPDTRPAARPAAEEDPHE